MPCDYLKVVVKRWEVSIISLTTMGLDHLRMINHASFILSSSRFFACVRNDAHLQSMPGIFSLFGGHKAKHHGAHLIVILIYDAFVDVCWVGEGHGSICLRKAMAFGYRMLQAHSGSHAQRKHFSSRFISRDVHQA